MIEKRACNDRTHAQQIQREYIEQFKATLNSHTIMEPVVHVAVAADSLFERVSKIVELLHMKGSTTIYKDKARCLDQEEMAVLRKLKAIHRARKHNGTALTTTSDENIVLTDDDATTTTHTRTIEESDVSDIHLSLIHI